MYFNPEQPCGATHVVQCRECDRHNDCGHEKDLYEQADLSKGAMMGNKKKFEDRKLIERWRELGYEDCDIAAVIGVHPASLSRKVKNGSAFSATQVILICDHIEEPMDMFITKT